MVTHTPDFSMPFNVNAVTHIVFGSLFINTFAIMFFNYREEEEGKEKGDGVEKKKSKEK